MRQPRIVPTRSSVALRSLTQQATLPTPLAEEARPPWGRGGQATSLSSAKHGSTEAVGRSMATDLPIAMKTFSEKKHKMLLNKKIYCVL